MLREDYSSTCDFFQMIRVFPLGLPKKKKNKEFPLVGGRYKDKSMYVVLTIYSEKHLLLCNSTSLKRARAKASKFFTFILLGFENKEIV